MRGCTSAGGRRLQHDVAAVVMLVGDVHRRWNGSKTLTVFEQRNSHDLMKRIKFLSYLIARIYDLRYYSLLISCRNRSLLNWIVSSHQGASYRTACFIVFTASAVSPLAL